MSKAGPIILIEDDPDDVSIMQEILDELQVPNLLKAFTNGPDAFHYLKTTTDQPFIIMSDVNLPKQNGLEFKKQIDADPELREKSIPFVFYSTSTDQFSVNRAYRELVVQGFFEKKSRYGEIKEIMQLVLGYWKHCRHPNSR